MRVPDGELRERGLGWSRKKIRGREVEGARVMVRRERGLLERWRVGYDGRGVVRGGGKRERGC